MLFGWLVPNTVVDTQSANKSSALSSRNLMGHKMKCNRSNILKTYSRLIHKSSGKNIVKIKSLLGEFQNELTQRESWRAMMFEGQCDTETTQAIDSLNTQMINFAKKWIVVEKKNFEFMNFLVELEQVGDAIRLMFKVEDQYLQQIYFAQAV